MQLVKLATAFAGAIFLAGCLPLSQGPVTSSIGPQNARGVLYGAAEPVYLRHPVASANRPREVEIATTAPIQAERPGAKSAASKNATASPAESADTSDVVYSDEWWKRENDAEHKLSRTTKICRC